MTSSNYIGRFAPSPSGPLHLGSLVCALASYLDAKSQGGKWLLRIEDIDPPREQAGASENIIRCIEAHGMFWDGELSFQSQHSERYLQALDQLQQLDLSYFCTCTRKRLSGIKNQYDGQCRTQKEKPDAPASIRLNLLESCQYLQQEQANILVNDAIQIPYEENLSDAGDFIIHRKDGLFAYQLAVVVDDIAQGITHIVRGADLYETCSKQIFLSKLLGGQAIHYSHIPVITNAQGLKLSKQNHAPAIDSTKASENLFLALQYLKQNPPQSIANDTPANILLWACQYWQSNKLQGIKSLQA